MGESIRNKEQWFKNNGWGFKDTEFSLGEDGKVSISGSRYQFSGQKMPKFKEWAESVLGLEVDDKSNTADALKELQTDPPVENPEFLQAITGKVDEITSGKATRIFHSHGHSIQELYLLRTSKLDRCVDYVVYITSHEQA